MNGQNEITVKRFKLSETPSALTFVDVLSNGEIILHELFADKDLPVSADPNKKYDYHVTFALRGDNPLRLLAILKENFDYDKENGTQRR